MKLFAIICIILTSNFTQVSGKKKVEKFIRIEINYGAYHSLKIFKEGILCKSVDSDLKTVFDFYPLKDLDYEKFSKIQNYLHLHEPIFFDMDSVQENTLVKQSSYRIEFLLIKESKIKQIEWLSGTNDYLKTILDLTNDLIPNKTRDLYRIKPF